MKLVLACLLLSACAPTTLETPRLHPANPDAHTGHVEPASQVLAPGYDPFEALPEQAPPPDPHQHHHPSGAAE